MVFKMACIHKGCFTRGVCSVAPVLDIVRTEGRAIRVM